MNPSENAGVPQGPLWDDPEWREREAVQRMLVAMGAMERQLDHIMLDQPAPAAEYVAKTLADVEAEEVADLLAVSERILARYRKGNVSRIHKQPERITLIGRLVYELIGSMTPRGVLLWFDAPRFSLVDRTPRQLLDEDPGMHREALLDLARGGRSQLDR